MISKCARGAALFVAAGLFLFSGCIFGTDDESEPKEPVPDYRPLTDKENVIHNLVESYKWADIEEYTELLHPDYVWFNQPEDVILRGLPEFYTREQDSAMTGGLFSAKLGTHEDPLAEIESLTLTISSGGWLDVTELNGDPCEDCWETDATIRAYRHHAGRRRCTQTIS